jgi:hypothetical protein
MNYGTIKAIMIIMLLGFGLILIAISFSFICSAIVRAARGDSIGMMDGIGIAILLGIPGVLVLVFFDLGRRKELQSEIHPKQ